MTIQTPTTRETTESAIDPQRNNIYDSIYQTIVSGVKVLIGLELAVILVMTLGTLVKSAPSLLGSSTIVEETMTQAIALLLIYIAPFAAYITCGSNARSQDAFDPKRQLTIGLAAAIVIYVIVSMGQFVFEVGPYAEKPTLGFTLSVGISSSSSSMVSVLDPSCN